MTKIYCDGCKKELDYNKMDYIGMSINYYVDNDPEPEHWDFCQECFIKVKRSMLKALVTLTQEGR